MGYDDGMIGRPYRSSRIAHRDRFGALEEALERRWGHGGHHAHPHRLKNPEPSPVPPTPDEIAMCPEAQTVECWDTENGRVCRCVWASSSGLQMLALRTRVHRRDRTIRARRRNGCPSGYRCVKCSYTGGGCPPGHCCKKVKRKGILSGPLPKSPPRRRPAVKRN